MPSSSPLAPSASFPPVIPRRVAVIGAGAGGLAAARELRREGHRVVVFERGGSVGGTWVYTSAVESDPLGLDPARKVVHSSLYDSLRTNLPRESMGFLDYLVEYSWRYWDCQGPLGYGWSYWCWVGCVGCSLSCPIASQY